MNTVVTDHHTPVIYCPACEYKMDRAACIGGETRGPKPGDPTICINCASILVFTDDMGVRFLVDGELDEIRTWDVWPIMEKTITFIKEYRAAERP